MISRERFGELLDGATPANKDELDFITNYRAKQEKRRKEREIEEQKHYLERQQAHRELYALIKSTFPKSFFYKHPISDEEYEQIKKYCFDTYGNKIFTILESPILRAIHMLPPKHPSGDDYGPTLFLEEHYFYRKLEKRYKINLMALSQEYDKYMTQDFIDKAEAIGKKYSTYIDYTFNAYDYLTDWQRYNV